jgi:hypothetical protein
MSNEAITAVAKSALKPSGRKFVAMALADYADEEWSCFPSIAQLAAYTSQGEKTVRDHLDALESEGYITRERQRRADGTMGRYRFIIQRRISPVADFASGEKQPKPAADFAGHNPHSNPHNVSFSARAFSEFWELYPSKVAKRAAEKSFRSALKRTSFEKLMDGLRRYKNKTDDRPWCNPTTWLNQDRWDEQHATVVQLPRGSPSPRQTYADAAEQIFEDFENGRQQNQIEDHNRLAGPVSGKAGR